MCQQGFIAKDLEKYRKKTHKEIFLEEMGGVVEPYYPAPKGAGS